MSLVDPSGRPVHTEVPNEQLVAMLMQLNHQVKGLGEGMKALAADLFNFTMQLSYIKTKLVSHIDTSEEEYQQFVKDQIAEAQRAQAAQVNFED